MLRKIEERTEIYKKNIEKQDRKEKGQFFTPAAIAKEMTTFLNEIKATSAKILDPGAGNGILSVAAVEVMIKNGCKKYGQRNGITQRIRDIYLYHTSVLDIREIF